MKAARDVAPVTDGAQILDDVRAFVARFASLPSPHALTGIVLWAAHTHAVQHFHVSPRIALLSPEAGSGKTRILELIETLAAEPLLAFSASVAGIYRKLQDGPFTLLLDEADAVFTARGKDDAHQELRALLNAGYKRGNEVLRTVGPKHEPVMFPAFAPVALAGLGDLPETVMTRSLIIRMRKRAKHERVEPWRVRLHEPEGHALGDRLAAWLLELGASIGEAYPDLPAGVEDRPAELWEPLVSIADAAGGHWPETARAACAWFVLESQSREASLGVQLLEDVHAALRDADNISTRVLLDRLQAMDERPWGDLRGKPINARALANYLRRYGVTSRKVRVSGEIVQGYRHEDLWDPWQRYCPGLTHPEHPEHPEHPAPGRENSENALSGTSGTSGTSPSSTAEPIRNTSAADDLQARARRLRQQLGKAKPDALNARYTAILGTVQEALPRDWQERVKADPLAALVSLELQLDDQKAGRHPLPMTEYFSAARTS